MQILTSSAIVCSSLSYMEAPPLNFLPIDRERRRRRSKRKKLQPESASERLIGTEEATRRLLRLN